jgi:putative tryptophan/tyrosine transport system substrate-binding protein
MCYWTFNKMQQKILKLTLCVLLSFYTNFVLAWENITIVSSNNSPATNQFITLLKQKINNSFTIKTLIAKHSSDVLLDVEHDTLVVAVGKTALAYAGQLDMRIPIIAAMIPKLSYEQILDSSSRHSQNMTAIYIDQSYARQFSLIKAIFPNIKSLGVLLGPSSLQAASDLQNAAEQQNLSLDIKRVMVDTELHHQLDQVTANKQVLLAIPDPVIYNSETTQIILLSTYHRMAPVIGFSQSYTYAGAIASVFSKPEQYANDVAHLIHSLNPSNTILPQATGPSQFTIAINRQVAKSLEINIANDNAIYQKILEDEK